MEKCHLASIRLPLSSPFRSERWGEGLFKRVLKGLRASLCLWNHPITHFYQRWTCKTRPDSTSKKIFFFFKFEISLNLNFKYSPAEGRPDFNSWFLRMERYRCSLTRWRWRVKLKVVRLFILLCCPSLCPSTANVWTCPGLFPESGNCYISVYIVFQSWYQRIISK